MTGIIAAVLTAPIIPVTVELDPDAVSGYGSTGSSANITTGLVVATPSGGTGPYTYAWAQTGRSPYTWTISAATAASTSFTCTALGPGNTSVTTFTVTVTDAVGQEATASISAYANNGQPYDDRNIKTGFAS